MKKLVVILISVLSVCISANAQGKINAFGMRGGYDALEFTYQRSLIFSTRMEITAGVNTFGYNTVKEKLCRGAGLNGLLQWVRDGSSLAEGINWYYGAGAAVLTHANLFGTGILGQVGVEYNFDSLWQISLDYRPGLYWLPGTVEVFRFSWNAPCLAVRYRF